MVTTSASTPGSRFRRYGGSLLLRRGHYPAIYRRHYEGNGASSHEHGGLPERPEQSTLDLEAIRQHGRHVAARYRMLVQPKDKARALAMLKALTQALEQGRQPRWLKASPPEF